MPRKVKTKDAQIQAQKDQARHVISTTRARLGMSQTQFASYLGVSVMNVYHWERGTRRPTRAALRLLDVLATVEAQAPDVHLMLIPPPEPETTTARGTEFNKVPMEPFPRATPEDFPVWLGNRL